MSDKSENTESKIIEAAIEVFEKKGFDGARMQEIADTAGINKSLLHYYFRSKSKLFEKVFARIFSEVVVAVSQVVDNSETIEELLESFVSVYINLLKSKPLMPNFVLHELNRDPKVIVELFQSHGIDKLKMIELFAKEGNRTDIKAFDPIQVIVNVLAMSVFPFVAKPIITGFIFDGDEDTFNSFIDERKEHIISFVKSAIIK